MNATRMPAALIAAAALLALTGCTTTTKATPARSTPTCHAVRTAGGDLVHGGPRPCLLTSTPAAPRPTVTATPSRPPAAHGQDHTTTAPTRKPTAPLQKAPTRKPTTSLQKDPAPAAKAPAPAARGRR